jgi:hypothetical protein
MEDINTSQLPNELVKKAILAYKFEHSANIDEKIQIQQWKHSQKHGDFNLYVSENNQYVECSIEVDGKTYTRSIPKIHEDIHTEIYPIGEVRFEKAELISVSAVGGFPWTKEAFSTFYWGTLDLDSVGDEDEWFKKVKILQQYYPPRSISSEPPECTVLREDDEENRGFMNVSIRSSTHCKTPNPWSYASFGVLYENENLAEKLLKHEDVHGDNDKFNLTPPESLVQPKVNTDN